LQYETDSDVNTADYMTNNQGICSNANFQW